MEKRQKSLEPMVLERERRFALAYFEVTLELGRETGAAPLAYRRAFPDSQLNESQAASAAHRLLSNKQVRALVNDLRVNQVHKTGIAPEHNVRALEKIAHTSMVDFMRINQDGTASLDLRGASFEQLASISELTTTETETSSEDGPVTIKRKTTIKLYNKLQALDMLNRIHGLYVDPATIQLSAAELGRLIESMKRRAGMAGPMIEGTVNEADSKDET